MLVVWDPFRWWSKKPTFQRIPEERWRKTDRSSIFRTCLCSPCMLPPTSINFFLNIYILHILYMFPSFFLLDPTLYSHISLFSYGHIFVYIYVFVYMFVYKKERESIRNKISFVLSLISPTLPPFSPLPPPSSPPPSIFYTCSFVLLQVSS